MLWQNLPAHAMGRIRSSSPQAARNPARSASADQHVLNVLGALRINDQTLRLYRGDATEPSLTRVLRIDERERRLYVQRSAPDAPLGTAPEHGPASLFGQLGSVWILMPCQILGDDRLGELACHRAEIPREILYLQVRQGTRLRIDPALDARIELRRPDDGARTSFRLLELSENGLALGPDGGSGLLPRPRQVIPEAVLVLPAGRFPVLELEVVHLSRDTGRAGARFRLPGKRARLRRWLSQQGALRPDAETYFRDSLSRSMR